LTFGDWLPKVFRVFSRSFARLGTLALIPVGVAGLYTVSMSFVVTDEAGMRQEVAAAAAADPTGQASAATAFWAVFGSILPIMLVFLVLFATAFAFYQGGAFYLALRLANGQPTTRSEALLAVKPRVTAFIGWGILSGLTLVLALIVPVIPAFVIGNSTVGKVGMLVSLALFVGLGTVLYSSLCGVVFIDRAGIARCFQLVKGQFWATFGRMAIAALIYVAYIGAILLVAVLVALPFGGVQALSGFGAVVMYTVELVLAIPLLVYLASVSLVTYAELRYHHDSATSTRTLAAEMTR
jgi:hypothetical protein